MLSFKTRLLGAEGENLQAKAWLSYHPKNLNARYESATTFSTKISQVPLTFEFDLPSKIESGKELKFSLNYFSSVEYPLSGLRVKMEYPAGFEFLRSQPAALEAAEWDIPALNKPEGGRIDINGILRGEVGEQKIFRAELGIWQRGEYLLLKEAVRGITIIEPSLWISQQINGNPNYIASPGDLLHYEILFKNIGEEDLKDLFLVSKLEGKALDYETIKAPLGETKPGDNSIVFDWRRVPELQFLGAGKEGKVEFWIELKDNWEFLGEQDKNPVIKNNIYLSQAGEEFTTRVNSKLVLTQKCYFEDEVFGNSGPIPPKVGDPTTYTVMWQVKNYYSDLKNVKVKMILPPAVRLTGKIFPEEQTSKFAFDSVSREIVWEIGDIKAGAGALDDALNLAFQISFTPGDSQRGQTPEITGEAKVGGEDSWTELTIEAVAPSVNTTLPDDEKITEEKGIVQ